MDYIAYLHKERHSDFGVSFPDFPGCIAAGKTLEEARVMAAEALAIHVAGMIDDGEPIPEPSTLDSVVDDEAMNGAVAFLVHVEPQTSRTVRINITARQNQVEEIDRLAAAASMTRSAYMVQSALSGVVSKNPARRARKNSVTAKRLIRPMSELISTEALEGYLEEYYPSSAVGSLSKRKRKA